MTTMFSHTNLMTMFQRVFGIILLLKGTDFVFYRLPDNTTSTNIVLVIMWVLGAAGLVAQIKPRYAASLIMFTGIMFIGLNDWYNHHLYLIVVIATILALFDPTVHPLLLRAQLTIVYLFAAVTKINGVFLSGDVIEEALTISALFKTVTVPTTLLVIVSVASVLIEAALAVTLWTRYRLLAAFVGVLFHTMMVLTITDGLLGGIRFVTYSTLMLVLYVPFFVPYKPLPWNTNTKETTVLPL